MAELTVPSKRRRALADALLNVQGPQPQMVGNQMAYNPTAGLLSGLAQGVGGYLKGKEINAAEEQEKLRRQELAKYLSPGQPAQYGDVQFSGGAPELAGIAESGTPSAAVTQPARPASFDYQSAIASALQRGDFESANQIGTIAKTLEKTGTDYFSPENYIDPATGKVFGGLLPKTGGDVKKLPFAVYKSPSSSYDPTSGALVQSGGISPEMLEGYKAPQAQPNLPFQLGGTTSIGGATNVSAIGLTPAKQAELDRKTAKEAADAARLARGESRDEERLRLAREAAARAAAKDAGEGPKKPLPSTFTKSLLDNQANLTKAMRALDLIEGKNISGATGSKDATGAIGYAPDFISQRLDPSGIDTRAAIADIGSMTVHDRSGAAVSATEFPRLQPFVPSSKDDPETVKKKLRNFIQTYKDMIEEERGFYSDSGYKVPETGRSQSYRESTKQIPPKNSKGWILHTDASGNKAYVSPDGKQFEEIK